MAFKRTSQLLNIGGSVNLVDGTTQTQSVNLPLSTLDREVFIVTDYQIQLQPFGLDLAAGGTVTQSVSINKTFVGLGNIGSPDTVAVARKQADQGGAANVGAAITQDYVAPYIQTTGDMADYIAVIATPDFVVAGNVTSTSGGLTGTAFVRITGYRAVASADLYAALVTEELNAN